MNLSLYTDSQADLLSENPTPDWMSYCESLMKDIIENNLKVLHTHYVVVQLDPVLWEPTHFIAAAENFDDSLSKMEDAEEESDSGDSFYTVLRLQLIPHGVRFTDMLPREGLEPME